MSTLMAERIRLVILTGDDVRDALKLAAARHRVDPSVYADRILREALAEDLAQIANVPPPEENEKTPRGRKK